MADSDLGSKVGFVDKRKNQGTLGTGLSNDTTAVSTFSSVKEMRTRLQAINPSLYTNSMLNAMTSNDMVYAIRLADESGGI